jgi:hypothetical protein
MRVWLATLLLLFSSLSRFQCDLKPGFGTTFLFAVVCFITFTNIAFMAFGVIAQTVVGVVAAGLAFAFDVAFLASGFAFALAFDVAFFTAGGFFANLNLTGTVLRAVR